MTTETANLPAVHRAATAVAVHSQMDDARYDRVIREAEAVYASTFLPATLTKNSAGDAYLSDDAIKANCVVVASVAHDMGVSFMAVAQSMSQVHGKLMFEGKLIAAVIEQRLGVRLRKTYTGEPGTDSYGIKVWSKEDEAEGFEPIEGTVGEWKTKERSGAIKAIWVGANKQKNQLFYMGARVWARLNAPGLMLGIVGDDEVDESAVAEHLAAAQPTKISAGFASQDPAAETAQSSTSKVDEKNDTPAESSTEAEKPKRTRAKKADEKQALSENMSKALDAARAEVDRIGGALAAHHPADNPTAWLYGLVDKPSNDEEGQIVLGRFNQFIDRGTRQLEQIAAAKDGHGDMEGGADDEPETQRPGSERHDPTPAEIIKSLDDVLRPLTSWAKIKETFSGFAKLNDWKGLGKADKAKIYAMVWSHANRLNVAATGAGEAPQVHPTDDATAYRCALEACDDVGILAHMWEAVKSSASYNGQAPGTRTALGEATEARLKQLKG